MVPIYLDYAATTPLDPNVAMKMQQCLTDTSLFGNAASLHVYGQKANELIEEAREQVASLIGALASEIIWTSGATEANNLAIKGAARLYRRRGMHLITVQTEHKAVLDVCQHLEKEGYRVTYLLPKANGQLDLDELKAAFRPDTSLVSIMQVNNETGIIQDIPAISQMTASHGILLHVDAAQSVGKVELNVAKNPIDLVSLSAHKAYGPKGVGALYLRKKPRIRVEPLFHGGGHEKGMRSGTLATHQIVGMGEAFAILKNEMKDEQTSVFNYRNQFINGLSSFAHVKLNTDIDHAVPHILNIRFEHQIADAILEKLPTIAASTASACQGKGLEGSHVLRAMGLDAEKIKSSIRFSFGRFTTANDIATAIHALSAVI